MSTAGAGAMYPIKGAGAVKNAVASATYPITGAGAMFLVAAGAMHSTGDRAMCSATGAIDACMAADGAASSTTAAHSVWTAGAGADYLHGRRWHCGRCGGDSRRGGAVNITVPS